MKNKIWLYGVLFLISLTSFVLQIFVFQKPNGVIGFLLCMLSIYLILASIIKMCRTSERFKNAFFDFLEIIFWLP